MTQFGKIASAAFKAPLWAKNAHVQTIYPKFFVKTPDLGFQTHRIDTPDGDFLDLAILLPVAKQRPRHIAVLFHGLEGSKNSHYVQHLARSLQVQNIALVVMHYRGCSGVINRLPRAYHSGETSDAQHCIAWIQNTYPHAELFAVGFSLGANMLLKLLGESDGLGLKAAVAICPPMSLAASAESVNLGFARRYQAHLLKSMKATLLKKMAALNMREHLSITPEQVKQISTFRQFDEHITAKLHGFEGADDYYRQSSAMHYLANIRTPSLVVHAKDDPFMDDRVIPEPSKLSSTTAYELSEHGGHVGFMYGSPFAPKLWLPKRIFGFIEECL